MGGGMERYAVPGRLTAKEFLRLPEDGRRHELVDGVHYVTPTPSLRHQELVGRLYLALAGFLAARRDLGRVILPLDVVLSDRDVVEPDLIFVAADQREQLTPKHLRSAPALAIEVLSPSTRRHDQLAKRCLFDEHGAREYWLVDGDAPCVTVHRRAADGTFPKVAELRPAAGVCLDTPQLPGWSLPLDELFADL